MHVTFRNIIRLLFALLLIYLAYLLVFGKFYSGQAKPSIFFSLLSGLEAVNLLIHEAGHFIFLPLNILSPGDGLGRFIYVFGGSFFQWFIPSLFVVYFWRTEQFYGALVTLFWVGESVLSSAFYISTSKTNGPVLDTGLYHDWFYLLNTFGLLNLASAISLLANIIGIALLLISIIGSVFLCYVGFKTNNLDSQNYY